MEYGDRTIYVVLQGKAIMINAPRGSAERPNFIITYQERDWSGFRSLSDCLSQFERDIAPREDAREFAIIERF